MKTGIIGLPGDRCIDAVHNCYGEVKLWQHTNHLPYMRHVVKLIVIVIIRWISIL